MFGPSVKFCGVVSAIKFSTTSWTKQVTNKQTYLCWFWQCEEDCWNEHTSTWFWKFCKWRKWFQKKAVCRFFWLICIHPCTCLSWISLWSCFSVIFVSEQTAPPTWWHSLKWRVPRESSKLGTTTTTSFCNRGRFERPEIMTWFRLSPPLSMLHSNHMVPPSMNLWRSFMFLHKCFFPKLSITFTSRSVGSGVMCAWRLITHRYNNTQCNDNRIKNATHVNKWGIQT